jgi:hypothetical protein
MNGHVAMQNFKKIRFNRLRNGNWESRVRWTTVYDSVRKKTTSVVVYVVSEVQQAGRQVSSRPYMIR